MLLRRRDVVTMLMSSVVSAIVTVSVPLAFNLSILQPSPPLLPQPASQSASDELQGTPSTPDNGARAGQIIASTPTGTVNVRYAPTVVSRRLGRLRAGDRITILGQDVARGDQWYEIQSEGPNPSLRGWVRSDFVKVAAGLEMPTVSVSTRRSSAPRGQADPVLEPASNETIALQRPEPFAERYSQADLDYFLEIATGSEFTRASLPIRKWEQDITIKVHGTPTSGDRQTLDAVVGELENLVGSIDVRVVNEPAARGNIDVYFVDPTEFSRYVPHTNPGRGGFVWIRAPRGAIDEATVLIASNGLTQPQRNHIIREEVTQALGLLNDSFQYRDSIFFQLWNAVTQYSPRDERVIQLLYHPEVKPGMSQDEALKALSPLVS